MVREMGSKERFFKTLSDWGKGAGWPAKGIMRKSKIMERL